jgi:hypothetical protein
MNNLGFKEMSDKDDNLIMITSMDDQKANDDKCLL